MNIESYENNKFIKYLTRSIWVFTVSIILTTILGLLYIGVFVDKYKNFYSDEYYNDFWGEDNSLSDFIYFINNSGDNNIGYIYIILIITTISLIIVLISKVKSRLYTNNLNQENNSLVNILSKYIIINIILFISIILYFLIIPNSQRLFSILSYSYTPHYSFYGVLILTILSIVYILLSIYTIISIYREKQDTTPKLTVLDWYSLVSVITLSLIVITLFASDSYSVEYYSRPLILIFIEISLWGYFIYISHNISSTDKEIIDNVNIQQQDPILYKDENTKLTTVSKRIKLHMTLVYLFSILFILISGTGLNSYGSSTIIRFLVLLLIISLALYLSMKFINKINMYQFMSIDTNNRKELLINKCKRYTIGNISILYFMVFSITFVIGWGGDWNFAYPIALFLVAVLQTIWIVINLVSTIYKQN